MSIRSIRRNKVKNATYSSKENHDYNRRRFIIAWQKIQVKKFGGIEAYKLMRAFKKPAGSHLDFTMYA
jgi:hypothetical protein